MGYDTGRPDQATMDISAALATPQYSGSRPLYIGGPLDGQQPMGFLPASTTYREMEITLAGKLYRVMIHEAMSSDMAICRLLASYAAMRKVHPNIK